MLENYSTGTSQTWVKVSRVAESRAPDSSNRVSALGWAINAVVPSSNLIACNPSLTGKKKRDSNVDEKQNEDKDNDANKKKDDGGDNDTD